jgi:acetate kinase
MAHILSVNAGSSSLKISLYRPAANPSEPAELVLACSVSNIFTPPATFTVYTKQNSSKPTKEQIVDTITNHASGFAFFLGHLHTTDIEKQSITHICHRVVHGGDYSDPVTISEHTLHHIEHFSGEQFVFFHYSSCFKILRLCLFKNYTIFTQVDLLQS